MKVKITKGFIEKTFRNQALQQKSPQRNQTPEQFLYKVFGAILKMDKRGTQKNRPKEKKTDDCSYGLTSKS